MGCEVVELSEGELQQKAKLTNASHRGAVVLSPDWWKVWVRNRIWIQNGTDTNIVVMVHRFNTISNLKSAAANASVDVTGKFGLGGTVEFALKEGHAQQEPISIGDCATVDLGGGAGGAYVTAWVNGCFEEVYMLDKYARPRSLLTVTPGFIL